MFVARLKTFAVSSESFSNLLLKKMKGSDVLDFNCNLIFLEQDNTNYFLLISSAICSAQTMYGLFLLKPFLNMPHRLYTGSEVSLFHFVLLFHVIRLVNKQRLEKN